MNSIETAAPLIVGTLDSEGQDLSSLLVSDPAALEMLRSMIGGIALQPGGLPTVPSGTSEAKTLPAKIQTLLTKALADESLSQDLAPIMTALQSRLSAKTASVDGAAGLFPSGQSLGSMVAAGALPEAVISAPQPAFAFAAPDAAFAPESLALMKQLLSSMQAPASSTATAPALQELQQAIGAALNPSADEVTEPFKFDPADTPPPPPGTSSLGHSILHSLGAHSSAAATPVAHAPSAERVDQVSALITQMADRVLVTDPLHGQIQEVRITLADDLMPGTDLRVWREDGGQLRVEFDTVSPYWARVLNEASPLLAQRLNERLGQPEQPAQVTVQHHGGQPEDGRSRNRQSPWDLARQALNS